MFSGIIEELGEVVNIQRIAGNSRLQLRGERISQDAQIGESIAVNGTCLNYSARGQD